MDMEKEQTNSIHEARTEKMVSQKEGKLTLRRSIFLKPTATSIEQALKVPNACHNIQPTPPGRKAIFKGWRAPQKMWKEWVDKLSAKYAAIWEQTRIIDGILSSTYEVKSHQDFVIGLTEFWCCKTNSFVFPWGEASITLEDVMILGGLPVLGEPLMSPHPLNGDLMKIEEELKKERSEIIRSKAKKATHSGWLKRFMEKEGSELEHVAFLSLWLSRFVFPSFNGDTIDKRVFPIAIRLSEGIRVALAPAVLASLYKDLRLLKKQAINSSNTVVVLAPFQLVQLWAFEHCPVLLNSSVPKSLSPGEPRVARWHKLSCSINIPVVWSVRQFPENFRWRPYAADLENWRNLAYYKEAEQVIHDCSSLEEDLQSFVRCLCGCELIGMDCKEKYMPQRVAMQFGFDQDLPADNSASDFLCKNPVVFVPARAFKPEVSAKYSSWWKSSGQDAIKDVMVKANDSLTSVESKSMKSPMKENQVSTESNSEELNTWISPEFPSNTGKPKVEYSSDDDDDDDKLTIAELLRKHASSNRISAHKADDATVSDARKRKWMETEVQRMGGDTKQVKKKNGESMDDPIEIADAIEEIAENWWTGDC